MDHILSTSNGETVVIRAELWLALSLVPSLNHAPLWLTTGRPDVELR